jgi:starch synthase
MVTPECAPVAQAGGVGDVVFGLSRELELRGNAVEIILPRYDCLRTDQIWGLTLDYRDLWVPWYGGAVHCSVWFGLVHGRKCFFIEAHSRERFFNRPSIYGFADDALRFCFFSKAALEYMLKAGKRPQVIHCHDWPTGLVPVLLFEIYKFHGMADQRSCYTIHNFRHQGLVGAEVLRASGLNRPEYYLAPDRMRDNLHSGALNLMKGGIVYANFVTTVSRHHAWEVMNTEQGFGLGPTLYAHRRKFGGVRNGVDYAVWNPEVDALIPYRYGANDLAGKYRDKEALRERLGLRRGFKPLVAYVGRLDEQKGPRLIRDALRYSLANGAQFVLLGPASDREAERDFGPLAQEFRHHPDCRVVLAFDRELAHLVYAGADLIVVPSNYEPCGLVQMIAMRYGTVPVVRAVGGLVETVFDRDYSDEPPERRNGYVFGQPDASGLQSAMRRALGLWNSYPGEFRSLLLNAMRCDYSFAQPARDYLNIYEYIRHK